MSFFPTIDSIVIRNVLQIDGGSTARRAIDLMRDQNLSSVVYSNGQDLCIFAMEDALRMAHEGLEFDTSLRSLDLPRVPTLGEGATVMDAFSAMDNSGSRYLAIVSGPSQLTGIVSFTDLVTAMDPKVMLEKKTVGELVPGAAPVVYPPDWILEDVLCHLVKAEDSIIVAEAAMPVGIITAKDAFRVIAMHSGATEPLSSYMKSPVKTVLGTASLQDALELLQTHRIKRVVVVDARGRILGTISQTEILKFAYGYWTRRYKGLLESTSAVPWEMDRASGTFTYIGHQIEALLGWTQAQWRNIEDWAAKLHPQDRDAAVGIRTGNSAGIKDHEIEYRILKSDGTYRWIRDVANTQGQSGVVRSLAGFIFDISDQKRGEEVTAHFHRQMTEVVEEKTLALSIAKEAAGTSNRAKRALLANMSHEFRTPLNIIIGMAELALRRATDSKQMSQLRSIAEAAHRLTGLLQGVLDLAQVEANRLTLDESRFMIADVIGPHAEAARQAAAKKHLQFALEAEPGLSAIDLHGDQRRLGQILMNLLENAIKFSERGSVVLHVYRASEDKDCVDLCLDVTDEGAGIRAEDRERIFDNFEQADSSSTRPYGGAGIGLPLCRHLARLMGGDIKVRSEPGSGSTFSLTVRLRKDVSQAATSPKPTCTPAAGLYGGLVGTSPFGTLSTAVATSRGRER